MGSSFVSDIGSVGDWVEQAAIDVGDSLEEGVSKNGYLTNFVQDYIPAGGLVTAAVHAGAGNYDYAEYAAVKGAGTAMQAGLAVGATMVAGPAGSVLWGVGAGAVGGVGNNLWETQMKQHLDESVALKIDDFSATGLVMAGVGGAAGAAAGSAGGKAFGGAKRGASRAWARATASKADEAAEIGARGLQRSAASRNLLDGVDDVAEAGLQRSAASRNLNDLAGPADNYMESAGAKGLRDAAGRMPDRLSTTILKKYGKDIAVKGPLLESTQLLPDFEIIPGDEATSIRINKSRRSSRELPEPDALTADGLPIGTPRYETSVRGRRGAMMETTAAQEAGDLFELPMPGESVSLVDDGYDYSDMTDEELTAEPDFGSDSGSGSYWDSTNYFTETPEYLAAQAALAESDGQDTGTEYKTADMVETEDGLVSRWDLENNTEQAQDQDGGLVSDAMFEPEPIDETVSDDHLEHEDPDEFSP